MISYVARAYAVAVDWANLITLLIGLLTLVSQNPIVPPAALPFIALAIGILNLVLKIWFSPAQQATLFFFRFLI